MQTGGDVFVPAHYRDRVGYSLQALQSAIKSSEDVYNRGETVLPPTQVHERR
jgi:hypothetical protein